MKMIKRFKSAAACILCIAVMLSTSTFCKAEVTTYKKSGIYLCGATYELPETDISATLERDFARMTYFYGISTISVYGLENYSRANREILFSMLEKYNIEITVRLEAYPENFTFSESDINWIITKYTPLLNYISTELRRDRVAYIALNMPVDDPAVQNSLGGLNSSAYLLAQPEYAKKLVSAVRQVTDVNGFYGAKLYLSVFYGWDNTYLTPSYASAGADGYFINNYSYPVNGIPADTDSIDGELISADKLSVSMNKYISQYGSAPLVVEFGFHTVSFNNGSICSQTAGLVADIPAKERAIKATLTYYRQNYSFVQGFQYFGYNILKTEGSDNSLLDWQLYYDSDADIIGLPSAQIVNSGFESGDANWAVTGGFFDGEGVQSEVVYSGNKALVIFAGTSGRDLFQSTGWFSSQSRIAGSSVLTARVLDSEFVSGSYKLTAELKRNNSTVGFYSSLSYNGGVKDWRELIVNIPASAAGAYDEILFKLELTAGEGRIYVDNTNFKLENSLVFNGGFENGSDSEAAEWGMWPSYSEQNFIDTDYKFEGMRSIGAELNINQNYSLYSTRVTTGAASAMNCIIYVAYENVKNTEIYFHINRGNTVVNSRKYLLNGSSDGFLMFGFSVPYDAGAQFAQVQIEIGKGSGHIWFDGISLQTVSGTQGDIDNNGITDIKDLVRIKRYLSSGDRLAISSADISGNGFADAEDIIMLKRILIA